jgi:hypothetical protein
VEDAVLLQRAFGEEQRQILVFEVVEGENHLNERVEFGVGVALDLWLELLVSDGLESE